MVSGQTITCSRKGKEKKTHSDFGIQADNRIHVGKREKKKKIASQIEDVFVTTHHRMKTIESETVRKCQKLAKGLGKI